MKKQILMLTVLMLTAILSACSQNNDTNIKTMKPSQDNSLKVTKSDEEWRKALTPEAYSVLREKSTERPFTGKYYKLTDKGTYTCAGCGAELFSSDTKFDAGCGWPSFYDALDKNKIKEIKDTTHGMVRTEVVCANCGGHLGHVFDDGPNPTGLRYCINSASLEFNKK
jgi:peptide-methionine (R)-S-oxide reductase